MCNYRSVKFRAMMYPFFDKKKLPSHLNHFTVVVFLHEHQLCDITFSRRDLHTETSALPHQLWLTFTT